MALEGQPISDHKPGLVWENNPDTPITATALSKATDLSVSYLDFKYNDPQNPLHREGTILMADPDLSQPAIRLVLKRGIVFSIINQVDEVTYPNGQYKIFDTGLDDLWITYDNKDNLSVSITGWGQNKQWFIFLCDERINNPETGTNTAQILVSQSSQYPQGTQVPGTSELFSDKDTRLIGGFKSDNSGTIIRDSVWDIAGKYHTVKAKKYMILDEYSVDDGGQHVYRPLRVSDLESSGITSNIDGDLLVSGSINALNKYIIIDNKNTIHYLSKNPDTVSSGVVVKSNTNTVDFDPIFSVLSSDNTEHLRVEYNGKVFTSNNTISINGVDITKNLSEPTGTEILGVDGYFYATRVYNAVYNDLAEYFLSNSELEYGKVYIIDEDNKIKLSNKKCSNKVVGVCSETPAFIMKQEYEKLGGIPIALAGTVKVFVNGKIKKGDLLISDKDGYACKANFYHKIFKSYNIIGKALEDNNSKTKILMLVK